MALSDRFGQIQALEQYALNLFGSGDGIDDAIANPVLVSSNFQVVFEYAARTHENASDI